MAEESYQKELFEFEKPKRSFPRLGSLLPKGDFEGKIIFSFTPERIVFISIGFIMCLVVVFALGVERGRSDIAKVNIISAMQPGTLRQPSSQQDIKTGTVLPDKTVNQNTKGVLPVKPAQKARAAAQLKQDAKASASKTGSGSLANKPFTIVAVTCKENGNALREVTRLKKEGFEASLYRNDKHFFVCVGSYATKDSATKALNKVKQIYRDAYIVLK